MTAFDWGSAAGAFAMLIGVAAVWLIIAWAIPPLRRRPGISYPVGMGLVLVVVCLPPSPPGVDLVVAAVLVIAVLAWQMQRAKRKQAADRPGA